MFVFTENLKLRETFGHEQMLVWRQKADGAEVDDLKEN